jgi:hypothetical protein
MLRICALVAPILCLCAACGSAGNLVGTWTDSSQGLTITLNPDSTYKQQTKKGNQAADVTGHYTFSGSKLTLTPEAVTGEGISKNTQDRIQKAMAPQMGKPEPHNIEFTTPDRIDMGEGMVTETLDRVK